MVVIKEYVIVYATAVEHKGSSFIADAFDIKVRGVVNFYSLCAFILKAHKNKTRTSYKHRLKLLTT